MKDRLYIDKSDRPKYESLKSEIDFLKDKDAKDLFLFAMMYGIKNSRKKEIKIREGYVRTAYLKDEDLAILKAISIYFESPEILNDFDKALDLCEMYAHAGIDFLFQEFQSSQYGSAQNKIEREIIEMADKFLDVKED